MPTLKPLLLALALALPGAATAGGQPGDEVLLLDLCVNDRCSGVAAVVVRGETVLIDRESLLAAGIDPTGLAPVRIGDRDLVDAAVLGHGILAEVDRAQLRVDLRQSAQDMARQQIDLRTRPRTDPVAMPWSASLNYAAAVGSGRGDRSAGPETLFLDGAVGRGHAALRSTAFWSDFNGWRRGMTRFEYDDVPRLRRWTVGDQFALARDPLGGGGLLGGAGVERAYDQDPYLVTFPQPFYSGVLEAPGTVEVYANGALIARRELGPGPFTLDNLGIPQGRSDLRIVVRDPFGGRSELAGTNFYGASTLLAPGLSDYAFRIGRPRRDDMVGDIRYDSVTAAQAWYRRGLNAWLTVGGRIEGDEGLRNAGIDLAVLLPFGELGLAVAASDDDVAGRGNAASLLYSYGGRHLGFGLGTRRFDAGYRRLGDLLLMDGDALLPGWQLREDDFVGVSWAPVSRVTLQANAGRQRREGQERERSAGLSATWRPSMRSQLMFGVQRHSGGWREADETSALLSYSYSFDRDTVNASVRRDRDGRTGVGFGARRPRSQEIGWGYDVNLQRYDDFENGTGQVEYQGRHGRYALQAEHFNGRNSGRFVASGGLVAIAGGLHATPPLESGYALVRVPGIEGVPVMRENRLMGLTNARGDVLVTGMLPFYANRLSIDHHAVPVDYDIRVGMRNTAVPRNAGALATMDVRVLRAATGHVRVRTGDAVEPARYGLLRLRRDDAEIEILLGGSGRYYVEDLAPGDYRATVEREGRTLAQCMLQVPETRGQGIADLGELVCEPEGGAP